MYGIAVLINQLHKDDSNTEVQQELRLAPSCSDFCCCCCCWLLFAAAAQVAGRSFMPLQFSQKPDGTKWTKEPVLQTRGSKFIKFQEARIQVRPAGLWDSPSSLVVL
jgi:hypothetical protein